MAELVGLVHKETGLKAQAFRGFSWTTFFFGPFPALARGDFVTFLIYLAIVIALAVLTGPLVVPAAFAVSLCWAFMYNDHHLRSLVSKGYVFVDSPDQKAVVRDLSADAYKIYLTRKYKIERNDVLDKFIVGDRLFEDIDAALRFADERERIMNPPPLAGVPARISVKQPFTVEAKFSLVGVALILALVGMGAARLQRASTSDPSTIATMASVSRSEITGDDFVWLNGKRIGYLDRQGPAFYRLDQLDLGNPERPVPKTGESGVRLNSGNEAAQIDSYLRIPTNDAPTATSKIEKTVDGFVWRDGKRIGWVTGAVFYPIEALNISGESITTKPGAFGVAIVSDDLDATVLEAAKLYPPNDRAIQH